MAGSSRSRPWIAASGAARNAGYGSSKRASTASSAPSPSIMPPRAFAPIRSFGAVPVGQFPADMPPVSGPGMDPQRRLLGDGKVEDVAAAILYLVSPAGRYITGQTLTLDGGFPSREIRRRRSPTPRPPHSAPRRSTPIAVRASGSVDRTGIAEALGCTPA